MDDGPGQIIILLVLLGLSAFFSSAETAITSISKIKLLNMVEDGVKGAEAVSKILKDPKKLLSSILVGNNLANIGATSIATSIAINVSGNNSFTIGIATGLVTAFILIFGEITPKTMANQNPEKMSLLLARPITFIVWLFTPLVALVNMVTNALLSLTGRNTNEKTSMITEAELKTMVNVSHMEGVLEQEEKTMINNVVSFGDHQAEDIMIPRIRIQAVSYYAGFYEVMEAFKLEQFSRMPVYKDNMDNIVGIIYFKDIILIENKDDFHVKNFMREPYFTYESKPLSKLFIIMRTKRISMAIVLDEYGGTSGLITLEDLIEEIVGNIDDEYDEENISVQKINDNEFVLLGDAKIEDVNIITGTSFQSEDYDSIGGYVMGVLGRVPEKGESFVEKGIRFIVESVEKNRVEKIRMLMEEI